MIKIKKSANATSWNYGTIGYNAYNPTTGQYGVVTAGHVATDNSSYSYAFNKDDVLISSKRSSWISTYDGTDGVTISTDAIFIPMNSSNIFTPIYFIKDVNAGYYTATGIDMSGETVYAFGVNSGKVVGNIINANATVTLTCNGTKYTMNNTFKTDFSMIGGDSGGPLCRVTNGSSVYILGILEGSNTSTNNAYFCKVDNINDDLGIQTYTLTNS
jgi:hypothetical protein